MKQRKQAVTAGSKEVSQEDGPVTIVNITKVEPNRDQPRKNFEEDALVELAESIKQYGIITADSCSGPQDLL